MRRLLCQGGSALVVVSALWNGGVHAQAAIDPNVAPRAAALERSGERRMAIDLAIPCGLIVNELLSRWLFSGSSPRS